MSKDKLTSDATDGYSCGTPPIGGLSSTFDDVTEDTHLINCDTSYHSTEASSRDPLTSYDALSDGNPFGSEQGTIDDDADNPFIGNDDDPSSLTKDNNFDVTYVRDATSGRYDVTHRAARSCELLHQGPNFSSEALNHQASKSCDDILNPGPPQAFDEQQQEGIRIYYEEFWPQSVVDAWKIEDIQFECFSDILERASQWLRNNPGVRLLNCETAEKKVTHQEEIYTDQLQYIDKGYTPILMKGLRLWLVQEEDCTNKNLTLKFTDIVPHCTSAGNTDIVTLADFYDDLEDDGHGKPQYETLGDALDRYNASLIHTPLKGRIVTVETVGVTISRDNWDGILDPQMCHWVDRWLRDRFYFLRIFYIAGTPAYERIGLADFVPDQAKNAHPLALRPCLATFDTLVDQARDWLNTIQGIRVTNVQTVETKYAKSIEFAPTKTQQDQMADKIQTQNSYEYSIETRPRALFLRIAYVLPMENAPGEAIDCPLPLLNCHTFQPAYVDDTTQSGEPYLYLEGLASLTQHVSDWLVRKGGRPISCQVLTVPQGYDDKTDPLERTLYSGEYEDGYERVERLNIIQMVRVFMDGPADLAPTEDGTLTDDLGDAADEYDTLNEPSCCRLQ